MTLFLFCVAYYLLAGLCVVVGYHRFLAHKSFTLNKWFQYLIITAGLPAGTPVQWTGNHRFHHMNADQEHDPHSPKYGGFWHAHNGWYYGLKSPFLCLLFALAGPIRMIIDGVARPRTNQQYNYLAKDILDDKYYAFISKPAPFFILVSIHFILPFSLVFYLWGWIGFFSLWLTLVAIYNLGDAIDSISHLMGENPYITEEGSRNNWLLAILTFGDGWHADHHAFPGSARVGFKKGRIDISWYIIKGLSALGIATNIQNVKDETVIKKLKYGNPLKNNELE